VLSIDVDESQLVNVNQSYLNKLHCLFEKNYNGNRAWLEFHEHIHLCERYFRPWAPVVRLNYRETSGVLEKKFNLTWLDTSSTQVRAGDVFLQWDELGKTPYDYWLDNEPNDLVRMCELCKPWLMFRPKLNIALEDFDMLENKKIKEFDSWWMNYHDDWCQHWQISKWSVKNQYSQIVIGNIVQLQEINELFKNNIHPNKISLV
jgi:hypothetical protein